MGLSSENARQTNSSDAVKGANRRTKRTRAITVGAALTVAAVIAALIIHQFGTHHTAHAAPTSAAAPASEPSYTIAVAADHGSNSRSKEVLRRIGADRPEFLLDLGDLSYDTISPPAWCQMVKDSLNAGVGKPAGDPYGENFPIPLVMGNHDRLTFGQYVEPICLPNRTAGVVNQSADSYGRDYYFNYPVIAPLARFIMASPGLGTNYTKGSSAYNWLANAIDSARAAGIKWVIVGNHFNHISSGNKKDETGADFFNLVVSKKVDLLLQGHDHTYQRSKQLALNANCPAVRKDSYQPACVAADGANGTYTAGAGTVLLINGLGGAETYPINPTDAEAGYFAKTAGKPSTGELVGSSRLVLTPTKLEMRFVGSAKTTFTDSFTITSAAPNPVLYSQAWTGANGAPWPAHWAVNANAGQASTQSQRGELGIKDSTGAYVRARLDAAATEQRDAQVSFSYAWNSTTTPAYASVFLRGSGNWQNAYRPNNGYGVQINPQSSTVQVQRNLNGKLTTLASVAGAQKVGTARQLVRFWVNGEQLRLKLWPEGTPEPTAWTWSGTDAAVSAPGRLHVSLVRSSSTVGAKTFTLDDLVLAQL